MNTITALSLYVINQVRLRRFILGISARQLSFLLEHSEAYVSTIESGVSQSQYPPHEYPKLAESLRCTVHDLLPPDEKYLNSTGKLVEKKVLNLNNQEDLTRVVEGLIDYGYFNRPKTLTETAKHLFIEKKEQLDLLQTVMEGIVKDGRLKLRAIEYYRDIV
jgi:transcriptional regulator with XRE-family HTH domain